MTGDDLSARLLTVAAMVTPGMYVYDVGCDHAFLSIYLVRRNISPLAFASDVRPGPVRAAREHVISEGLENRISVTQRNGIKGIDEVRHPATLILAGMGGPLILQILGADIDTAHMFDELIVSPQSCIEEFRSGLTDLDLRITEEKMVHESGKFYTVMKLKPGLTQSCVCGHLKVSYETGEDFFPDFTDEHCRHIYDLYGYALIAGRDPVLARYLEFERRVLNEIAGELDPAQHKDRSDQLREQIADNEHVSKLMEGCAYGNSND